MGCPPALLALCHPVLETGAASLQEGSGSECLGAGLEQGVWEQWECQVWVARAGAASCLSPLGMGNLVSFQTKWLQGTLSLSFLICEAWNPVFEAW